MKSDNSSSEQANGVKRSSFVYWLAISLVFVGLLNVTPAIPGWDGLWKTATGLDFFKIRRFPTEWLYPIVFTWMMLIVALAHSIWRSLRHSGKAKRGFGLFLDVLLVFAAKHQEKVQTLFSLCRCVLSCARLNLSLIHI